jgi:hypothetical protein
MPGTYNANANAQQLADAVAMDPKLKGELYSRYLEQASQGHNAFAKFTSESDKKSGANGGVRSIFALKKDLKAGGTDTVNFNVLGPPGGPGVMGSQELTGNTSSSLMATYKIRVGWFRDAVEFTRDVFEFLSAGKMLDRTTFDLLSKKMGLLKQNHMMMRLIRGANGNVFRPNNRATTNDLIATDTVSLAMANSSRARLRTIGGQPIYQKLNSTGSQVDGFLQFYSDMAMLNVRNDDGYQSALAQGGTRGDNNENFTGELVKWSGMPWYEFPSIDEKWDDFIGSPLQPKAVLKVAFSTASAGAACVLKSSTTNVKSRYFQFFRGYDYLFTEDQTASPDAGKYYAWIVNPDMSVGFVEYTGTGNNGNQIVVDKILSPNGAGTSAKGYTTVGDLSVNTTANPDIWLGGNGNLPAGFTYTDSFVSGAVIIQANSKGTQIGYGFVFGAMSACYAHGRIEMAPISQERDYGFVNGRGYETIFGTGLALDPFKKPCGYLLSEVAMEHEGYPTPSVTAAAGV